MDKLKMHSPDFTDENIVKIAALFPNCVTEVEEETTKGTKNHEKKKYKKVIDWDLLKQELSSNIVDGPRERYHLNWPGKREALLTANAPIAKTLRPCRDESVDFDTTKNLFIEGDNLDALKLLQETYPGKVKMIYIDPPYNTGKDFIYSDKFAESSEEYLLDSGQKDDEGNRLIANPESNGRFHSDWLSMMYSRLKLARNLLKDDGVIFISIDDGEQANLKRMCDEIFGEENFVGNIIWKNVTDNNPTNIATEHEYLNVYAKFKINLESLWKSKLSDIKKILVNIGNEFIKKHSDKKELQDSYTKWFRENKFQLNTLDRYKYIDFGGVFTGSQSVHNPGKEGYRYDVIHPKTKKPCKEPLMGYRFPKTTMDKLLQDGKIIFGSDHNKIIELKVYAKDYLEKLSSIEELDGRLGAYDLRQLFVEIKKAFTNPKPIALLKKYFSFILGNSDIILDFFAGSATTAHAVMQLNAEDGGNRKFIMVQLPEACDEKSEAFKAGYKTIAEISKERIRRAGKKIREELTTHRAPTRAGSAKNTDEKKEQINRADDSMSPDTGFRVLKIDSSNMVDVYYTPDAQEQDLFASLADNIKTGRSAEDLLFQVLLDWGVDLTLPVVKETVMDRDVFFVDEDALAACFVKNGEITEEFCKELAKRKPLRVVFRDSGFRDDSTKINVAQIFKLMSPHTDVRSL